MGQLAGVSMPVPEESNILSLLKLVCAGPKNTNNISKQPITKPMTIKEIFELRKEGKTEEAYQAVLPMYKVHHGHYTTICMFWCAVDMAQLHINQGQRAEAVRILKSLCRLYPSLDDSTGAGRHTLMSLAIQVAKYNDYKYTTEKDIQVENTFSFIDFAMWWDLSHLTEKDWWSGQENEQKRSSRGQEIAMLIFQEAKDSKDKDKRNQALRFIKTALEQYPNDTTLQTALLELSA